MKIKLTEEQMEAILYGNAIAGFEYEPVEDPQWEVGHKMQSCEVIFEHNDKYYSFGASRHGDEWQGWEVEFWDNEAIEVQKESYIAYRWVQVNNDPNSTDIVDCSPNEKENV